MDQYSYYQYCLYLYNLFPFLGTLHFRFREVLKFRFGKSGLPLLNLLDFPFWEVWTAQTSPWAHWTRFPRIA